ncbi:MAG: hypothetical protein KDD34_06740 [Bdellovibrionales bacterium]|nr:hypothetical protein [Bdellovibrionales bacterium]
MFQKVLAWALLFSFALSALAQSTLSPLPESPNFKVSNPSKKVLACSEIMGALKEYNELARGNEAAIADFLLEITTVMYDWHNQLSPLEGKQILIPNGTFQPIYDGTQQIEEIVGIVYENSDQLKARMELIIESLESCL